MHPSDLDLLMKQEQHKNLLREVENMTLVASTRQTQRQPAKPKHDCWYGLRVMFRAWFMHAPRGRGHGHI